MKYGQLTVWRVLRCLTRHIRRRSGMPRAEAPPPTIGATPSRVAPPIGARAPEATVTTSGPNLFEIWATNMGVIVDGIRAWVLTEPVPGSIVLSETQASLMPGGKWRFTVAFRLPDGRRLRAGRYDATVMLSSCVDPSLTFVVELVVEVEAVTRLYARLVAPPPIRLRWSRAFVDVGNAGTVDATVEVSVVDSTTLRYRGLPARVQVAPGAKRDLPFAVKSGFLRRPPVDQLNVVLKEVR